MKLVLFIAPAALVLAAVFWLLLKNRSRRRVDRTHLEPGDSEIQPAQILPSNEGPPAIPQNARQAEHAPLTALQEAVTRQNTLAQIEATQSTEQQNPARDLARDHEEAALTDDSLGKAQPAPVPASTANPVVATGDSALAIVRQPSEPPTLDDEPQQGTPTDRARLDKEITRATTPETHRRTSGAVEPPCESTQLQNPLPTSTTRLPGEEANGRHENAPAPRVTAHGLAENEADRQPIAADETPSPRPSDEAANPKQVLETLPMEEKPTEAIEVSSAPSSSDEPKPISNRKKIIQIHTTDQPVPKPDRSKHNPVLSPRERAPKTYDPPDISECTATPTDAYDANEWPDYRKWNRALSSFFLLNCKPGATACLTITPKLLAAAWQKAEGALLTPDEASTSFSNAVGSLYRRQVLVRPQSLKILKCSSPDHMPLCTAVLGLAVLAAYTMRTEGGYSANAYYARLADLLVSHHESTDSLPLDQDEYYALWAYVRHWLQQRNGATFPLPSREDSARFYVNLALFHAPLRQVDIERLPRFFISAKYGPGEKPPIHELDAALRHWCTGRTRFTEAGSAALNDDRQPAVLAQIAHELETWDGTGQDEQGQTNANIDLHLAFPNRQPTLAYAARCPPGFPLSFNAPPRLLTSSEGGWYEPVQVPTTDGPSLTDGFTWQCESRGTAFALRRPAAKAIAFALQEQQGSALVSQNGLPIRSKSAAMCRDSLAPVAAQYLTALCGRQCTGCKPPNFPEGWTLFVGLNITNTGVPIPEHLEALSPDPAIQILCVGGLKAEGGYLKDAPPQICINGTSNDITLNDQPAMVDESGFIQNTASLLTLGPNKISTGNRNRIIALVDSDLAPRLAVYPNTSSAKKTFETVIATPTGAWHTLGPSIGDVGEPIQVRPEGNILLCKFQPLWAICCESRIRPKIVLLHDNPPPPEKLSRQNLQRLKSQKKFRKYAARWVSTIRFANHPLARIVCADGTEAPQDVRELWASYKKAAREAARHLRKR